MSFPWFSVYAPTEVSDLTVKDILCHARVCNWSVPRRDTLLVLGDFNASTGTDRDGYETCLGPNGFATVNQNSTKFLDFTRSRGLRVAGSWLQHPQTHAGLGIPTLMVWQRRLTTCSLIVAGELSRTTGSIGVLSSSIMTTGL